MNEEDARFDSGFDDGEYFLVSPEPGGVSLQAALRDFGPAAIDDLIPRLRTISSTLDAAHGAGTVHGALHPSKVFVTDESTSVVAGATDQPEGPYVAPEVAAGEIAGPRADQFAFAAIVFEWLFGKPITGHADRPIDVRLMPGVDRHALSKAFSRALARDPWDRFASCGEFVDAIAAAVVPELPLAADDDEDPVEPFVPEDGIDDAPLHAASEPDDLDIVAKPFDSRHVEVPLAQGRPFDSRHVEVPLAQGRETKLEAASPDFDAIDRHVKPLAPPIEREPEPAPVPVSAWNPSPPATQSSSQQFGATALILATLVGAVFGFAAGYMARPRALQSGAPQQINVAPGTDAPLSGASGASGASGDKRAVPSAEPNPAPKAPNAPEAPRNVGRLLVRSTPSGANVTVDGVARGVTPLSLSDLSVGNRTVIVARRGYIPETRTIQLTTSRPSRTVDVRLAAAATERPAPNNRETARPSTPATLGRPAAATGSVVVESRPIGAAVSINGRPSGTTPVTINDLSPGEYRVVLTLSGYRSYATTVRVVAGERTRAAASLTAVEQE